MLSSRRIRTVAFIVRPLLLFGLTARLLIWIAAPSLLAAQSVQSQTGSPKKFIFLLPDGFNGWVCVDFGIVGAAPLPREGNALVIRPRQSEVLATSDKTDTVTLFGEAWFEVNGQRRPLPNDVSVQAGPSRTGTSEPTERQCAFVGTIDERDAAEAAPGFENRFRKQVAIPPEERRALEAIYKSTDGEHWKHRVGWLGPPGTECSWHGVQCGPSDGESMRVVDIDLYENNLAGVIPQEIGQLKKLQVLNFEMNQLVGAIPSTLGQLGDLEWLAIFGNHFLGLVPAPLIQRWLAGALDISAEAPLLTEVSEIDFESRASALLCASHRIILHSDTSAVSYTERCRGATPDDRATFCEVKEGRIGGAEFARLGWLIEKNGFFDLSPEYSWNMTHALSEDTRVTKNGKSYALSNYAGAGPLALWMIQRAIEGVATNVEWEKTSTQTNCPRW
jgi:hypothetical protein